MKKIGDITWEYVELPLEIEGFTINAWQLRVNNKILLSSVDVTKETRKFLTKLISKSIIDAEKGTSSPYIMSDNTSELIAKLQDENAMLTQQLYKERALADRLAGIIQSDRDGWLGQEAAADCDCDDCKYIRHLDSVLDAWKEVRKP
jgi:hypothetical protein